LDFCYAFRLAGRALLAGSYTIQSCAISHDSDFSSGGFSTSTIVAFLCPSSGGITQQYHKRLYVAAMLNLKPGVLRLFEWTVDFDMYNQRNTHAQVWI